MPIRAVTLDCAETLIKVDWRPEAFAVASAEAAGLRLPVDSAHVYKQLYYARLPLFIEANRNSDHEGARRFYEELCFLWLERVGEDPGFVGAVMEKADELAFGPSSILFEPFSDSLPAVRELKGRGLRLAVLSNWDLSLHRVLRSYGFEPYLEFGLASLEIGVEKPAAEFFLVALEKLGLQADEVLHVGDLVVDDVEGAEGVGMHACLIDRSLESRHPMRIQSLLEIPEVIQRLS